MVKADSSWPCPRNVAWQASYLNCSHTLWEPRLSGLPADRNTSTCHFPGHTAFPGFTSPSFSNLGTVQTEELQGFLQYPNHHQSGDIQAVSEQCLKERDIGGAIQHENPVSLPKKFLIFDQSGDKTRLFYTPIFPFVQSPNVAPTKFIQASDEIKMGQAASTDENYPMKYSLPEDSNENHVNDEESELHEDTEEINALLYSDEDVDYYSDDEVASTACSPLATKRCYGMQDQFENMKEEVASSDQPNKRQKLNDDGCERSSPINSAISVRLNESCHYTSDAESKYCTSQVYSAKQTRGEENLMMGDIQFKKDKIHESLKVLENLVPGAQGKEPLSVIDGTIEYLKSLMSQTGTLGFGAKNI